LYGSPDGGDWIVTRSFDGTVHYDLVYGGGRYVSVGSYGTVSVSTDGSSWSDGFVGDSVALRAVCWDGHKYIAGTTEDGVYHSTDGLAWTRPTPDPAADVPVIRRLVFGGGKYVAVGNAPGQGSILEGFASISGDGVNWTVRNLGQKEFFEALAWTGSHYVACGRNGQLITSTNGLDWTDHSNLTDNILYDIVIEPAGALVTGGARTTLVSP
jgi:hypothetical protein